MKYHLAALTLIAMTACSHGGQSNVTSQTTPAPSATNATGFPLYNDSTILTSRDWQQTISSTAAQSEHGIYQQGAGTYAGRDVIASTPATMQQLTAWLHQIGSKPPEGYSVAVSGSAMDQARAHTLPLGVDFETFQHKEGGKQYGVVVMTIDPQTLDAKAGTVLALVGKYKMLPQGLRDPLDAQVKKEIGFTVSDALSPATPIGAALGALDQLRASGERGIVVVDAAKQ